jgi:hypothetical protein
MTRTWKKGDVVRMKIETTIEDLGAKLRLTSKSTVTDIKDTGNVIVETQDEAGKLTLNGSDMDIPAGPATTLTYEKSGKLVDFKVQDGGVVTPEVARQLEILRMPILAAKEVNANDSWQTEFNNPAVAGKKFTVKSTYLGLDKVDGTDLWKVKQEGAPETDDKGAKMTVEATFWLDPATGMTVKAEVKIKDQPTTMYGTHSFTSVVTRIKPEGKKAE